ncbi:hypothetical protein KJF94_18810 [Pseudomonas hormoni]|uniref:Uncharacterized protein n=1 Tax=Pseudomonas hormoni TaxID=3093767 RepID=A0ABX8ER77_9PSED|nr:hypothetical protein [Pseudomonas hormoni]QVW21930.1 hypothetical protein KJF94_18810 [Pseudomonas hormoni]
MTDLKFAFSSRDDLPDALFSMLNSPHITTNSIEAVESVGLGAILGYPTQSSQHGYSSPYLIVLPSVKPFELFAWLKTYAPETFPLSQFCRVISRADFDSVKKSAGQGNVFWQRPDRWPSVILGEMLAQSDGDSSVPSIPLSRATATYSFSVARASISHRDDNVTQECINRLESLSSDRKFVERLIHIKSLQPIWGRVGIAWNDDAGAEQLLKTSHSGNKDLFGNEPSITDYMELLSDSAEHRVVAFRNFAKNWHSRLAGPRDLDDQAELEIALAAFLVGRGTSHAFLLKDIVRSSPSIYVWFGLIAALCGPTCWDPAWARAVKSIEKSLKSNFSWEEISPCDISWAEYRWLDSLDYEKAFQELPKLLPKVLSMEVVPGVVCQFRLKSAGFIRDAEHSGVVAEAPVSSVETDMLYKFVSEFMKVADKNKLNFIDAVPASSGDTTPKTRRTNSKGGRK